MNSHNHTQPSIPSHPYASYHFPLQTSSHPTTYTQQLPSFSTAFQTFQTHQHPPVQHLSHHAHWLSSSLPYTQPPVSTHPSLVNTLPIHQHSVPIHSTYHQHSYASSHGNQQLPPLISTSPNTPPSVTTKQSNQTKPTKSPQPPKPKKKPSPTKRTRSKLPSPATNPSITPVTTLPSSSDPSSAPATSPMPQPSPHPETPNPSTNLTTRTNDPNSRITFPAPGLRAPTPGLNFADVALDTPVSPRHANHSQFSVYQKALTARERVAPDALTNENVVQPENHRARPHRTYQRRKMNQSVKKATSKRVSGKASKQRAAARKRAAGARSASDVVQQETMLLPDMREIQSLGNGCVDINPTTNSKITAISRTNMQPAQGRFEMQRIERSKQSQDNQDKVEMAAELLATLAQIRGVSHEGEQMMDQRGNIEQTLDCQTEEEAETRRVDPAARATLNSKSRAHLKQSESQKVASNFRMQNGKPPNNSPNFVSRSAYSTPIPRLPPSHLAETQPASSLPSSGAMDVLDKTQPEYPKATPVGIRDSRNLFSKPPSESLPDVSRNHSHVTTPNHLQHCTRPGQRQQQSFHRDSGSSSNPSNAMYPTHHSSLVRPLFGESVAVTSPMVPHQPTAAAMFPQSTSFLYNLSPHSNIAYPRYQPHTGGQHPSDTQQPLPQSSQPLVQQAYPPQFQQASQHHLQPTNELVQPSDEFLQSSQQHQQPSPQVSHPSAQFSQPNQKPSLPSPQSSKPSQRRRTPQSTGVDSEHARTSKVKKRKTKKPVPRNPSEPLKTPKPKNKRAANKSTNPKRPRAPKKPLAASSPPNAQAPRDTASTPSLPRQAQLPLIPSLAIPTVTKPPGPGLRLHANHGTQHGTFSPQDPTTSQNRENASQQQFPYRTQQPSTYVRGNANGESHLQSSWPQQHPVPTSSAIESHNVVVGRSIVDDASKEGHLPNPNRGNTSAGKRGGILEKAHSAAEKAAREGREVQSALAESAVSYVPKTMSQERHQVLRLHPPLAPTTLHTSTSPSSAPPMLPPFQNLSSAQQSLGLQPSPVVNACQPVFAGNALGNATNTMTHPSERAGIQAVPTHGSHTPAQSVGRVQGTFSPRTESTQQTLPPDSYSHGPSDTGFPLDAVDNVPPSQARDQKRCSAGPNPSNGQPAFERIRDKSHSQPGAQDLLQQGTVRLILTNQSNPAFDGPEQATIRASNNAGKPNNAAKRKRASKSSTPTKRRKKNKPANTEQESSTNKDHVEANKGIATVMEDATENGATNGQSGRKLGSVSKRVSSSKKSGKGQSKSKVAQRSKPVQKRVLPGTKTQRKSKPNQSKAGEAHPASISGSGLRLCLCLQKEDGQQSSEAMTDPNEDSCDSPDTLEKVCSGPKRASKSPQKKTIKANRKAVKVVSDAVNKKIQISPCFAEELKNLRTSGILNALEGSSCPSPADVHDEGIPKVPDIPCALCQHHGSSNDMVKHPCFPLRVFDICKTCSETVSRRVEENGAKRKEAEVTSEKAITEQTTLFVMLIEEMVRHFTPSDRKQRDVNRVYEFISNRNFSELVERGESISVNFDMLTVLRVLFRKVGFSMRGGKLRWPAGEFTLPSVADTRALVSNSIPARIEDLKRGILPGEAAWDKTFLEHEKFCTQRSSCAIYEKIFKLVGLKLVHVSECSGQSSSVSSCDVKFDAVSMGALMYRTAAMLSGTVTQELLAKCWTKEEALRIISEVEIGRLNGSFQGAIQLCCICGGSGKHLEGAATPRFSNCTECLKSFCSICLLNVLGTSEYLRSFEENGYCCMLCRLHKNAELNPGSKINQGKKDHRVRLRENAGIKKGADKRAKSVLPLLLLSQKVRSDVLLRSTLPTSRKSLGFAMFCEVANENSARCGINPHSNLNSHDMCLECKLPVDDKKLEGEANDSLRCGQGNCPNVMHKTCFAPQRQIRRRGSRSKWCCPHHQCSKCEQHDGSKLLRCRTCPATYCKEHMPSPSEIYVFSEKSFACFRCRTSLRIPQHLRLKLSGSKSDRKRNAIAQALAIDQRKRSAVVKKLSEGPGPKFFGATAFNELQITT